jgi:hypothetical protein
MNPITGYRYISCIYQSSRQGTRLDERSLDILEQFIWEKYLSAYQIHSKLKSTPRKLAYKNVNKRLKQLLSSDLLEKVESDSTNSKHNAIQFRLTEYGIYQLFLNRLSSIAPNKIEVEEPPSPPLNSVAFLRNYSDSDLFQIFVYPYFKKETLLAIGPIILFGVYSYLSTCCHGIESEVKNFGPWFRHIFSWNEVPGKDNIWLLKHLQEVFKLENIDRYDIKKEDAGEYSTITVNVTSASLPSTIMIKLDKKTDEVHIMSTAGGRFKQLQYEVRHVDQEMRVTTQMPKEWSSWYIVGKVGRGIEQIIYEFVCRLASEATETRQEEYSYYSKILSQDDTFMKAVHEIYQNRHKDFERGYEMLTNRS